MAMHSHVYRPYRGERTSLASRWMVVCRYALADALALKKTLALLVLGAFPLLIGASMIYVRHNVDAIALLPKEFVESIQIDGRFFFIVFFYVQSYLIFLMTAAVGPRVLVNDLRDNALPLYLSRPLTRSEYVLGKAAAIVLLGSVVSWVPNLILFGLQAALEDGWFAKYWWLGPGIVLSALAAIVLFALVCLAISAVVRRRAAAGAAFVASFFVLPAIAGSVNAFLHADWWVYFAIPVVMESLSIPLFRLQQANELSATGALVSLLTGIALSIFVLSRRIRAWEVVG